jgi:dTDP-4-dehydrorhamnose 3,5-epimerase
MRMTARRLEIPGLRILEPPAFPDRRGALVELFRTRELAAHGLPSLVQMNVSWSNAGVLRGLHYQRPPHGQGKLVTALVGEVYDVVVDIRHGSPTFGRWTGVTLSETNHLLLYVPEGLAHGFCVSSDRAVVLYGLTAEYAPGAEAGVRWNDPQLAIRWPTARPVVSERDAGLPLLEALGRDFVFDAARA